MFSGYPDFCIKLNSAVQLKREEYLCLSILPSSVYKKTAHLLTASITALESHTILIVSFFYTDEYYPHTRCNAVSHAQSTAALSLLCTLFQDAFDTKYEGVVNAFVLAVGNFDKDPDLISPIIVKSFVLSLATKAGKYLDMCTSMSSQLQ